MKKCPTCGASAPDSATQCPSCQQAFESGSGLSPTDTANPPSGGPGAASDPDRSDSVGAEPSPTRGASSSEDDVKSTHFGLPSASDSNETDTDDSEPKDEKSTQFGLPSSEEADSNNDADDSDPVLESSDAFDDGELDWSSFDDDLEEAEGPGSSLLSVWGISSEGSVATTPPEDPDARPDADDPSEANDQEEAKRTQMGMPRFDPDRVKESEVESGGSSGGETGAVGDESTAPGAPQQSEPVGFDESGRPGTKEVEAGSLQERARQLREAEDDSDGGTAEQDSPSSGVARVDPIGEAADDGEAPDGGVEPDGTYLGKPAGSGDDRIPESAGESGPEGDPANDNPAEEDEELLLGGGSYMKAGEGASAEESSDPPSDPSDPDAPNATMRGAPTSGENPSRVPPPEAESGSGSDSTPSSEDAAEEEAPPTDGGLPAPDEVPVLDAESASESCEEPPGPTSGNADSTPDEMFAAIEESGSDVFADENLEEVDVEHDEEGLDEDFAFFDGPEPPPKSNHDGPSEASRGEEDLEPTPTDQEDAAPSEAQEEDVEVSTDSEDAPPLDAVDADESAEIPDRRGGESADRTLPVEDDPELEDFPGVQSRAQDVLGGLSGVAFAAYLGFETVGSGIPGHFLMLALTIACGLFAATNLIIPFVAGDSGPKTAIFAGSGLLVAGLAGATLVAGGSGLQVGPLIAIGGAISAIVAGLAPVLSPQTEPI